MNTYFFRSPQTRAAQLIDFAQAVQFGKPATYPTKMWCRITVDGEEIDAPYDLLASEPDAFDPEEFDDIECMGAGEVAAMRYMTTQEIIEEMQDMDLFVPAVLLRKRSIA
jgi:hypothetical protein